MTGTFHCGYCTTGMMMMINDGMKPSQIEVASILNLNVGWDEMGLNNFGWNWIIDDDVYGADDDDH